MQLCKPYGRVVRLRLNAGAIKHQAFVEFENVNVAMQMIYSFVGSADPPRVRPCCGSDGQGGQQQRQRLSQGSPATSSCSQPYVGDLTLCADDRHHSLLSCCGCAAHRCARRLCTFSTPPGRRSAASPPVEVAAAVVTTVAAL